MAGERAYLDASVIVALFTDDVFSERAERWLALRSPVAVVSDFAAAEFASAIARLVRTGMARRDHAADAFVAFDTWADQFAERAEIHTSDVVAAAELIRRLDMPLRTPDALNIAITRRAGADLATFDSKMAASAVRMGMAVADL